MDNKQKAMQMHYEWAGKIEVVARCILNDRDDLSLAYTPGVAEPCLAIAADYEKSFELTRRHNLVAVVTDGSAVLGLGNIGPSAAMPVMEGKCALFKEFGGVDAFPICIDSNDVDVIVDTVALISKSFGGVNLEDIAAPRCFEIERKLKERCDIPIFHDDQHGTAIVVAAALINAMKVTGKEMGKVKIVVNGAGAAGIAVAKLLLGMQFGELTLCDRQGILCEGDASLNPEQAEMVKVTNLSKQQGTLADALVGADVFIGLSGPRAVTTEMVSKMNKGIVFAMANPEPEIYPDEALAGGAAIVGTGRSDFPNQINNSLVFPGLFKGTLMVRASDITEQMKWAVAYALAAAVPTDALGVENILPPMMDKSVPGIVARAVAAEAVKTGIARRPLAE